MRWAIVILVALCLCSSLAQHDHKHPHSPSYQLDQAVPVECIQADGSWGPPPPCVLADGRTEPWVFLFGKTGVRPCAWHITASLRQQLQDMVDRKAHMMCRVPMMPDRSFHIPFALPMWGINTHTASGRVMLAVDNHINFLFHTQRGFILGVGAYPLRDRFELAEVDAVVHIHGVAQWFRGHQFDPLVGPGVAAQA